jgi:uncharacterized Zn finger protein (UPF0148 family)
LSILRGKRLVYKPSTQDKIRNKKCPNCGGSFINLPKKKNGLYSCVDCDHQWYTQKVLNTEETVSLKKSSSDRYDRKVFRTLLRNALRIKEDTQSKNRR